MSIAKKELKTKRFDVLLLPKEPWRLVQPFPQFTNNVVVKILGYVGWLQQFPKDSDDDSESGIARGAGEREAGNSEDSSDDYINEIDQEAHDVLQQSDIVEIMEEANRKDEEPADDLQPECKDEAPEAHPEELRRKIYQGLKEEMEDKRRKEGRKERQRMKMQIREVTKKVQEERRGTGRRGPEAYDDDARRLNSLVHSDVIYGGHQGHGGERRKKARLGTAEVKGITALDR